MASAQSSRPTELELSEVETKLRQLLLDVAAYIDETSGIEPIETAVKVPEELTKEKIVLRFTGGWVRDKLLGVGSHDIDVAINKMTGEHFGLKMIEYLEIPGNAAKHGLDPREETTNDSKTEAKEESAKDSRAGEKQKSRKIAPGLHKIEANPEKSKNLETATTKIMGIDLDLVNLRKETYNEVSRNPEIEFGTPEEDAMRRDATVNAMFYNLNTSQIEDFTGRGWDDMQAKVIRTPLEPYQTFKDDPLRVLRLIRFASRLDYTIDPATEKAMSNAEIGEVLKIKISRERVGIELEKMLKGPDPLRAMSLIDNLGLYDTIFTDPTRELGPPPNPDWFGTAYRNFHAMLSPSTDSASLISEILIRNEEERYLGWICAALMPWADAPMVPHPKRTQKPYYAAHVVAREGFKAPNKIADIITVSQQNGEEIRRLVEGCYRQVKRPNTSKSGEDCISRDVLGMAIRRWGASWRTEVLWSFLYEVVLDSVDKEHLLTSYSTLLAQLTKYSILEAHTFKPLITGTQLAKALDTKPGPWMRDALDVVMAWQLRNPDVDDPNEAIAAVKADREAQNHTSSELPSRLASHFLQLTIRPLFQTSSSSNLTPAGHFAPSSARTPVKPPTTTAPWKDPKNAYTIDLLRWSISCLTSKTLQENWPLVVPPILTMLDDTDVEWKIAALRMLTSLLHKTPQTLLARTGLAPVFEDTIWPLFTHLPTLTPEAESAALFDAAIPAMEAVCDVVYPASASPEQSRSPSSSLRSTTSTASPNSALPSPRQKHLTRLLRSAILHPLSHAPAHVYPHLATTLLSHLPRVLRSLGLDTVAHLQTLTALLESILSDPLAPISPGLLKAAIRGLKSVIECAWPRVGVYRGVIMQGLVKAWWGCGQETKGASGEREKELEEGRGELRDVVRMLHVVLMADEEVRDAWVEEKRALGEVDGMGQLLDG
ncbi:tRNA nucleotidyltransferase [Sporormia fimetaria CBS 119925]|uniref:tRNA nucleotidyltransferase n=1 Tax=Sporormia fimetaria CBS 119925 TaxID=1340428 RepID=A0A6A6VL58_9PLEO|nr:tRNA nucleotidyltransferase [Sporormia fimetaria CBS 119925]